MADEKEKKEEYEIPEQEGYVSQYKDQINTLTKQYNERPAFSYDPAADAGYQSYVNMMKSNGEAAMRDTMAKAASLTGGYGNSYAVAAGQSAYNDYLRQADAAQGEFYDRALATYNADGNELLTRLSLLQEQDNNAYDRWWNEEERGYQREQDQYEKAWNEAVLKEQYGDPSGLFKLGVSKESYDAKLETENLAEYEALPMDQHSISFRLLPDFSFHELTAQGTKKVFVDDKTGKGYTTNELLNALKKAGMSDDDALDYLYELFVGYQEENGTVSLGIPGFVG